jgi:subtilisin family serine protease
MRSLSLGALAVICVSVSIGLAQAAGQDSTPRMPRPAAQPQAAADGSTYYIVRLKDAPAATYTGGVPGYAATSARARGETTLDVAGAASYAAYLDERQSAVLATGTRLLGRVLLARFRYHYAMNGMSLKLTAAEAQRLATLPGVLSVRLVQHFAPSVNIPATAADTNASRVWINAPKVWVLPTHSGTDNEGEGMVLADLDTGINHANLSFADSATLDGYTALDPTGVRFGVCDASNASQHGFSTPLTCNDKLIGAYSYTHGSNDPDSPEDSEGHGSHTASEVVGDFVSVSVLGAATPLSGLAPHASLIVYDVCEPAPANCSEDNSVAAVDQAIQDQAKLKAKWGASFKGMVLNFSIGGSNDSPYDDPVDSAFLNAVEAGIYVSAAGGNGGPAEAIANDPTTNPQYQVQHLGPWVATMAAATHDGAFSSNKLEGFTGGDPSTPSNMTGVGVTGPFGPQPLVYSGDFSDPVKTSCPHEPSAEGCPPSLPNVTSNAKQCLYPFPASTFTASEIVVCDRGTNPLVDKAYNVMKGGAAGMVIATTASSSQEMVAEPYVIPATLVDKTDGNKLRAWLAASAGSATPPSADISGASLTTDRTQADQIAGFSSRGPNGSDLDAIIKPDLSAPGVSVLGAISDPLYTKGCTACSSVPESYDFFDGTSMATPHDAGAATLLKQAHPTWSPSEIKSALMLTAVTGANGTSPGITDQCASLDSGKNCIPGTTLPTPQVRGAGRIDVDAAERTGLIMDESGTDYEAANPANGGDLSSLNLASLGNTGCAGSCSWTRTVKNPFGSASVTYSVSVSRLTGGLKASVTPTSFRLAPGQSQVLAIAANSAAVTQGDWAFGEVDITPSGTGDGGAAIPDMHMPMAVEASAPSSSTGGGGSGSPTGSGSKGGGGGDLGLFGLASLLLAWRRKNAR